jgi:hypothetical protein
MMAGERPYRDSEGANRLYVFIGFSVSPHEDDGVVASAIHGLEKIEQLSFFSSSMQLTG